LRAAQCSWYVRPPPLPGHRDPPSFPTRRSSDLLVGGEPQRRRRQWRGVGPLRQLAPGPRQPPLEPVGLTIHHELREDRHFLNGRSEEHTSELQSRENLVCRLLLAKKHQTKRPTG